MVHMNQQRQGPQSTMQTTITRKEDSMKPLPHTKTNEKTNHVYMTITNLSGKIYSDQTGQLPVTSSQGNYYVTIFYIVNGSYIKFYPIKSQHRNKLLKAHEELYSYLRVHGYLPQLHK